MAHREVEDRCKEEAEGGIDCHDEGKQARPEPYLLSGLEGCGKVPYQDHVCRICRCWECGVGSVEWGSSPVHLKAEMCEVVNQGPADSPHIPRRQCCFHDPAIKDAPWCELGLFTKGARWTSFVWSCFMYGAPLTELIKVGTMIYNRKSRHNR